jgi:hypothetical protein
MRRVSEPDSLLTATQASNTRLRQCRLRVDGERRAEDEAAIRADKALPVRSNELQRLRM